jgi:hypothetical protein
MVRVSSVSIGCVACVRVCTNLLNGKYTFYILRHFWLSFISNPRRNWVSIDEREDAGKLMILQQQKKAENQEHETMLAQGDIRYGPNRPIPRGRVSVEGALSDSTRRRIVLVLLVLTAALRIVLVLGVQRLVAKRNAHKHWRERNKKMSQNDRQIPEWGVGAND